MKAMFAYDHKFFRNEDGDYYSSGQFPYRIWERYLEVFDEIVVAARVRGALTGERIEHLDLSSGPHVRFVEIPNMSGPITRFTHRGEATRRISKELGECDALIVRGSEIGRLAASIATRMSIPWAIEVVSCPFNSLWNYGTWQGKVYAPIAAYEARRLIRNAPFALYVSREFLQRRYPSAGRMVACSDVQLKKSGEQVLAKRLEKIVDGHDPFIIGLIGSLSSNYKGVDTVLKALRLLGNRTSSVQFHVLGGGDPERWKKMADDLGVAKQTLFCGTLPNGDPVNAWLDGIDLYVQPSYAEGLPRALIEAMNRGCPALGSTVGGIPELLGKDCLHEPGDSKKLASLIQLAIENKDWQNSHARNNFSEAARYDISILDQTRRKFWNDFAAYCQAENSLRFNKIQT